MVQQRNEPPTDGDTDQPFLAAYKTWKPVFGTFLDAGVSRHENVAALLMLGAHVIAVFVLLIGLKLFQWLS